MKKQNAMLENAGCRFSPVTRSGASYSFTSRCDIQGVSAQSKSVIQAEGDAAYKVNVESRQGGESTKESLTAKRIGDRLSWNPARRRSWGRPRRPAVHASH